MTDSFPYDVGYDVHAGGSATCAQRFCRFNLHPSAFKFNLYVFYTILVRISCCSIIKRVMMIYNLFQIVNT